MFPCHLQAVSSQHVKPGRRHTISKPQMGPCSYISLPFFTSSRLPPPHLRGSQVAAFIPPIALFEPTHLRVWGYWDIDPFQGSTAKPTTVHRVNGLMTWFIMLGACAFGYCICTLTPGLPDVKGDWWGAVFVIMMMME